LAYTVTEDSAPTDNQNNGGDPGNPSTGGQDNSGDPEDMGDLGMMEPNGLVGAHVKTGKADGAGTLWYEINYNHRQAWVPASEVTLLPGPGPR
jgi:hypothetical protein